MSRLAAAAAIATIVSTALMLFRCSAPPATTPVQIVAGNQPRPDLRLRLADGSILRGDEHAMFAVPSRFDRTFVDAIALEGSVVTNQLLAFATQALTKLDIDTPAAPR